MTKGSTGRWWWLGLCLAGAAGCGDGQAAAPAVDAATADSSVQGDAGTSDGAGVDGSATGDAPAGGSDSGSGDTSAGAADGGSVDAGLPCSPTTETCNGKDDDCDGQTDEEGAVLCGDANDCTTDSCTAGACQHAAVTDGAACNAAATAVCSAGACACKAGFQGDVTTCVDIDE